VLVGSCRHIVTIGVTSLSAQIGDEEVDVVPLYRDPIHDFGICRFDPSDLSFGVPAAIPLRPEACKVGAEIRIIGNDAGERRQVLSASIARMDRNAPSYGRQGWNDYNTHYIGAASNTSGGSSGSPVLNIRGEAVAINAGGATQAASAMYLPLWPAVRALERIRRGEPVPRGDCHAIFTHIRFHEALRAGVPASVVERVRADGMKTHLASGGRDSDADAGATGMLQVSHVLKGGVCARGSRVYDRAKKRQGYLQAGDVLHKVNGRVINTFWPLEVALDAEMERLHAAGMKGLAEAKAKSRAADLATRAQAEAAGDDDDDAEDEEEEEEDDDDVVFSGPWTSLTLAMTAEEEDDDDGARFDGGASSGSLANAAAAAAMHLSLSDTPDDGDEEPTTADDPDSSAAHPSASSHGREALGQVSLSVLRAGKEVEVRVPVVDAHALVPRRVLEIGGAGLAEVEVGVAIRNGLPQGVVVLNKTGFVFADASEGTVVRAISGKPVTCLADAAAELAGVPEDSYFSITTSSIVNPSGPRSSVVCYMTRRFHPARILSRHVADDCAADTSTFSRWITTNMPKPVAAPGPGGRGLIRGGGTQGYGNDDDDDAVSLPGTGPVLLPHARMILQESVRECLGGYDLSPEALGGGGMADEAAEEDDDVDFSELAMGGDGERDEDSDDGAGAGAGAGAGGAMELEIDPGAVLAAAAAADTGAATAQLVSALRDALPDGADADDGTLRAVAEGLIGQAKAAMSGAGARLGADTGGSGSAMATEADTQAMAKAIRAQRLYNFDDEPEPVKKAALSLVGVESRIPLAIDGVEAGGLQDYLGLGSAAAGNVSSGKGVVVDKRLGIVLVDRAVVPIFMAIVHVIVGVTRVPARVLYVSPASTFALVQADLSGIAAGGLKLAAAVEQVGFGADSVGLRDMALAGKKAKSPQKKDKVWFLTLDDTGVVDVLEDDVYQVLRNVDTALPAFEKQAFSTFRVVNMEVFEAVVPNGIAVNAEGEIVGMISDVGLSAAVAVSAEWLKAPVTRVIGRIKTGADASLRDLGVQLEFTNLADAQAAFGMSPARVARLMNKTAESEVLVVAQICSGSLAGEHGGLRERDVILDLLPDDWTEADSLLASGDGAASPASASASSGDREQKKTGGGFLASVAAALGLGASESPRPSYMEDLKEPLQIQRVSELILRCRLRESVRLRVLRDGREVCVTARTDAAEKRGASKLVVQWQGMTMTPPDPGLLRRGGVPWVGVPEHRAAVPVAGWNNGATTPHEPTPAEQAAFALHADRGSAGPSLSRLPSDSKGSADPKGALSAAAAGLAPAPSSGVVDLEPRLPAGVVCCFCESGSEASSELRQAYWVLKIADTPVPTLDDVLYVTSRLPDRESVSVTVGEILSGQTKVITLRPDSKALPLQRFLHGERFQWRRQIVRGPWTPGGTALQRQSSLSTAPSTLGASDAADTDSETDKSGPDAARIAGAVIGTTLVVGAAAAAAWMIISRKQRG
jgi:hypothetical protein